MESSYRRAAKLHSTGQAPVKFATLVFLRKNLTGQADLPSLKSYGAINSFFAKATQDRPVLALASFVLRSCELRSDKSPQQAHTNRLKITTKCINSLEVV